MLPQYIRLGPPTTANRRNVRSKEKILILLLFITLAFICFGGVFYLPDNFGASDKVLEAYKRLQNAGPEIFIPAPPIDDEQFHGHGVGIAGRDEREKHLHVHDRNRFQAKVNDDLASADHLEKPEEKSPTNNEGVASVVETSSEKQGFPVKLPEEEGVGNAPEIEPRLASGEDSDPVARERRNKVREVSQTCCVILCGGRERICS